MKKSKRLKRGMQLLESFPFREYVDYEFWQKYQDDYPEAIVLHVALGVASLFEDPPGSLPDNPKAMFRLAAEHRPLALTVIALHEPEWVRQHFPLRCH